MKKIIPTVFEKNHPYTKILLMEYKRKKRIQYM
jgi:hypothetical protein